MCTQNEEAEKNRKSTNMQWKDKLKNNHEKVKREDKIRNYNHLRIILRNIHTEFPDYSFLIPGFTSEPLFF